MELPSAQKQFLVAAYRLTGGEEDRRIEARALIDRLEFGEQPSGWIIEAVRNLGALGYLLPYKRDGGDEDQFIQITPAGVRKAAQLMEDGIGLTWLSNQLMAEKREASKTPARPVEPDGRDARTPNAPGDKSERGPQALDFSTGEEHRISVDVRGWPPDSKNEFSIQARRFEGVETVRSAGGSAGFYVYFDPTRTSVPELSKRLEMLAHSIGVFRSSPAIEESVPADALTIGGDPITLAGNYITIPTPALVSEIKSSKWTGITNLHERALAFKELAPITIAAVDTLIEQLENSGHNGGPPLDDRAEAIEALKSLHHALGALLAAVESSDFEWCDGEGLVTSCVHFALRAHETLRDDPIPFATSGLVLAICAAVGFPGLGGLLSGAALAIRKHGRP